jgi:hypothetical protein
MTAPLPHQFEPESDGRTPRPDRLRTVLLVGRMLTVRGDHLCRVRNVSTGGMMIESTADVTPGEVVRLELRNLHVIDVEVRWVRDERIGVRFDAERELTALLSTPEGDTRAPRAPRLTANASVLLVQDGHNLAATLLDLSQSGCRVRVDRPLPVGAQLRIMLARLPARHAAVRWQKEGEVGLSFTDMLSFAELVAWGRDLQARFGKLPPR